MGRRVKDEVKIAEIKPQQQSEIWERIRGFINISLDCSDRTLIFY